MTKKIPEASSCKYFGIILRSDLNWVDQVIYLVQKTWKALHFVMRVLKKRKYEYKILAYTPLVRPVLKYGAACSDPCRGQKNALDRVQMKAAQFTYHTKDSDWETLAQSRTIARLCHFLKRTLGNGLGKL